MNEEFEKWWRSEMNVEVFDLARTEYPMTAPQDQAYKCLETQRGWLAWQASRKQALKDAARLVAKYDAPRGGATFEEVAAAIRAMQRD
jgi:hypothetical protein